MKPLRKIVGYALVAAPFLGIGVYHVFLSGWFWVAVFFGALAVMGVIALGVWMTQD